MFQLADEAGDWASLEAFASAKGPRLKPRRRHLLPLSIERGREAATHEAYRHLLARAVPAWRDLVVSSAALYLGLRVGPAATDADRQGQFPATRAQLPLARPSPRRG